MFSPNIGGWIFPPAVRCLPRVLFEQIVAILDPEPHSAALNMALDEALLQRAGSPTLRIYGWSAPAVSFGYFGHFTEAHQAAAGREIVRRWTGGGLVEHGADVTYTLLVPRTDAFFRHSALESYRLIHEQIAQWLIGGGIEAGVAAGGADEASGACFVRHVRYDIVANGTKLAGAAQRRTRWGLLHQGSIQVAAGPNRCPGTGLPPLKGTTEFAQHFAGVVRAAHLTTETLNAAQQIAAEKYATAGWLRKF
jgi:lipoate-protein ligase A